MWTAAPLVGTTSSVVHTPHQVGREGDFHFSPPSVTIAAYLSKSLFSEMACGKLTNPPPSARRERHHPSFIAPPSLVYLDPACYTRGVKYVPSALIGQLSRSSGSTTASRNRYGSYLRTRNQPADPSTAKQTEKRAWFTFYSQQWRTLTDNQRAAWKALGEQMTRSDSLGQSYSLTGLQAYTSCNALLTHVGAANISDAPAYSPPPNVTGLTITLSSA